MFTEPIVHIRLRLGCEYGRHLLAAEAIGVRLSLDGDRPTASMILKCDEIAQAVLWVHGKPKRMAWSM
ncbi:hypothetical protein [Mechercharimyces sp. CAU 1602]|uniref:hypothetical protein n=1 Tax=Mechercharimyces sp. CAU 1602 TaxID=2973933 RepID=UPI002161F11B|nr:hypothetical protein [Mechercharimyces sp. CAU 1602]MCS1351475.1 hypothetical protein [Mechercharimyces sp. CAU 1602]